MAEPRAGFGGGMRASALLAAGLLSCFACDSERGPAPAARPATAAAASGVEADPETDPAVPADTAQSAALASADVGARDYLGLLESRDPALRAEATRNIDPEGMGLRALLVVLEEDPDPRVRVAAVAQVEDADDPAGVRGLVAALGDGDRRVVLEAIDALEFAGDEAVVPDLQPLLDHPDQEIRRAAAEAIAFLE